MAAEYPSDMDPECIPLCDALNALPTVKTTSSCCGHGTERFMVFFQCASLDTLLHIVRAAQFLRWQFLVQHNEASDTLAFALMTYNPIDPSVADLLVERLQDTRMALPAKSLAAAHWQ